MAGKIYTLFRPRRIILLVILLFVNVSSELIPTNNAPYSYSQNLDDKSIGIKLAEKFAPILYFYDEDAYYPVSVEYTLLKTSSLSYEKKSVLSPNLSDLTKYATYDSYLDLVGDNPHETEQLWLSDLKSSNAPIPTYYARILYGENITIVQYWFNYLYSNWGMRKGCNMISPICYLYGGNNHEGDWEMIQIILEDNLPTHAVYSQHNEQVKRGWQNVEKENERPVVYVGWGSHASFFKNAEYSGFHHTDHFSEQVGTQPLPSPYQIVMLESDSHPSWLSYRGMWGAKSAPRGPQWDGLGDDEKRSKWIDPINYWLDAEWDVEKHYGRSCKDNLSEQNRTMKICASTNSVALIDGSGHILIDKNENVLDSSKKKAEYISRCESGHKKQYILFYKPIDIPIDSKIDFNPKPDTDDDC